MITGKFILQLKKVLKKLVGAVFNIPGKSRELKQDLTLSQTIVKYMFMEILLW